MKLTVLVDNNTKIDDYYLAEPGLSFFIEEDNHKILFDTGYSDIFLKNAKSLNIDLGKIDYLILSHGHNDHTGGLEYLKYQDLKDVTLIAHPDVFTPRSYNNLEIGSPVKLEELKVKEYIQGNDVIRISDRLYFLGHIERTNNFENKEPIGLLCDNTPDYLEDDSALVYQGNDGLFIITACSHSGICNIIEYAKKIFNNQKVIGVIGGFHLLKDDNQLKETIKYLEQEKIPNLYPCHCVSLYAKHLMYKVSQIHEVAVGLKIKIK